MSSNPTRLSYAHRDVQTTRFAKPFVVWAFVVGALAIVSLTLDFAPAAGRGQISTLLQTPWASGGTNPWLNLMYTLGPIRLVVSSVAGLMLLSFGIVAAKNASAVTSGSLWLIRIAGIVLCFAAAVSTLAGFASNMYAHTIPPNPAYPTQQMTLVQAVLTTISSLTTAAVPAVLVLLLCKRDSHTNPSRLARPASVLMLCIGLPLFAMFIYQMAIWAMGTRPYWLLPPDPRMLSGLKPGEQKVASAQRLLGPLLSYGLAFLALAAGWAGLTGRPVKRLLYGVLAIFWILPTVLTVAASATYLYNQHSNWGAFAGTLTRIVLGLLFPLVAWWSVQQDPAAEPTP